MQKQDPRQPNGSFLHAFKAIAWAFFGVRGKRGHDSDLARLKPIQVIAVGLLMAAVFVLTLVAIANWAVS